METYTLVSLLLTLIVTILMVLLYRERSKRETDLQRYRDAATKHRAQVAEQKDRLIAAIVDRAKLYDKSLPPCNLGVFNKVVELYIDQALEYYDFPIDEHDNGHTFTWERPVETLSSREIFALWIAGVIE